MNSPIIVLEFLLMQVYALPEIALKPIYHVMWAHRDLHFMGY